MTRLARHETDNTSELPDGAKIEALLNDTTGALQQHCQLRAGSVTTYEGRRTMVIKYYRATSAAKLRSLQHGQSSDGPTPMHIGAYGYDNKGKNKGKTGGKGNGVQCSGRMGHKIAERLWRGLSERLL